MMIHGVLLVLGMCSVLVNPAAGGAAGPEQGFAGVGTMDALEESLHGDGRVLVSFSVPWCMGCVRMDREVWADPRVLGELAGLYGALRPDEGLLREAGERYGVPGYPTLVLFEGGEEIGRLAGFWEGERVVRWLSDPGERLNPGDPRALPIGEVHDRGVDLILAQRWDEASRFLCVFWVRSRHDEGMTDTLRWLRSSRYESMLRRVCEDPAGRERVEGLWGSMPEDGPAPDADERLVRDWLVLGSALGHEEQTDAWVTRMLGSEEGRASLRAHERVFERLVALGRLEEAGGVASRRHWSRWLAWSAGEPSGDPIADAAPARVIANEGMRAPERVRLYIKALRAAGRGEEADELEEAVTR